jgi:hypothetical protein
MTEIENTLEQHIEQQIADEIFLRYSEIVKCNIQLINKEFFVTTTDTKDESLLFSVKVENKQFDIKQIAICL